MKRNKSRWITGLLLLAVMALIFAFSAQTGEVSSNTSGWVVALLLRLVAPAFATWSPLQQAAFLDRFGLVVRKLGHFTEFMLLGMAAALHLAPGRSGGPKAWCLGTLYAVTDEVHQHFVEGRAPAVLDVMIDSAGTLTGVLLMTALLALRRRLDRKPRRRYNSLAD